MAWYCLKYPQAEKKPQKKQRALYAKVKCHCCEYSMKRTIGIQSRYYCDTPKFKHSPDCVAPGILEEDIENAVIQMMQAKINVVREENKAKELIRQRLKSQKVDHRQKMKQLQISVSNLNNIKFRNYELYKDGKMTKEDFRREKSELDGQIRELELRISEYELVVENNNTEESGKQDNNILHDFLLCGGPLETLTRQLANELIDKIIVYDSKRFEIVWKFSNLLSEAKKV